MIVASRAGCAGAGTFDAAIGFDGCSIIAWRSTSRVRAWLVTNANPASAVTANDATQHPT
jgi:hypothetical protein